ncbi:hypothetical protein AVEN_64428-1 [Araneus ventricosus]|uniref:Uncharacterized protein n=1 Tax=Araneus ventricosus TaxID=182803 RepID=A0A4Y2QI35_ARAVE|nr:hypothetical protein AVEN_49631-1 [Araneus ventricosus]GBN62945.1 hypothetical protein AVEN_64428-1 [Araneus ventricosus]
MPLDSSFGNASSDHTIYVTEITDNFILGLDSLKKYNFILDFKDSSEFSFRRCDFIPIRYCLNKTCQQVCRQVQSVSVDTDSVDFTIPAGREIIIPILRQITDSVLPQTDPWGDKEVRLAEMEDPDINQIIKFME